MSTTTNATDTATTTTLPCMWQLRGRVIHGHGRGGKMLGCPTANVELDAHTIAALKPFSNLVMYGWGCVEAASNDDGDNNTHRRNGNSDDSSNNNNNNGGGSGNVADASTITQAERGPWPVALSVGYNPHFRDVALTLEVHFLHHFAADFYGHVLRIVVVGVIREQRCFDSLQALIDEIDRDKAHTTRALQSVTLCAHQHDRFVQPAAALTAEETHTLPFVRMLTDNKHNDGDDGDCAHATRSNGHTPATV